jgi:hypothetical protein
MKFKSVNKLFTPITYYTWLSTFLRNNVLLQHSALQTQTSVWSDGSQSGALVVSEGCREFL